MISRPCDPLTEAIRCVEPHVSQSYHSRSRHEVDFGAAHGEALPVRTPSVTALVMELVDASVVLALVTKRFRQPRSSHSRLTIESRSPVPLQTKADAPTSMDRSLMSGSFIAENTTTLASGLSSLI